MQIRVRIAPSPTGELHLGTARTTLFNWLFARQKSGAFILRIEDTDRQRSKPEYERDIFEHLRWLGLEWDEGPDGEGERGERGPYRQSQRSAFYERYLTRLLQEGYAYYCYCTKEELEFERQSMLSQGLPPRYSGRCRGQPPPEREAQIIRFRMPDTRVSFRDIIRGEVSFNAGLLGDIAIAKNIQTPFYNLAAVIDDHEMGITHVIRGEDHLSNTPKQLLLMEALGFSRPHYAHLPLILDRSRGKLSKSSAATAVAAYRQEGYLPEALVNFSALLGWHPPDDRELFSLKELVEVFDLARVQKGGAAFNPDKLNWMNEQYLRQLPPADLAERLGLAPTPQHLKIVAISRERMVTLNDFAGAAGFFFNLPDYPAALLLWQDQLPAQAIANLELVRQTSGDHVQIMALAERYGRGVVLWPLRVALSGQRASPGPLEIIDILGQEETARRINLALEKLKKLTG